MLDFTDIIGGPLKVLLEKTLASKIGRRVELLFEIVLAAVIAFFAACGTSLMSQSSTSWAVGCGMVTAAVAMFATFQASPNAKGLTLSVSQKIAAEKLDNPTTTIQR